VRFLLGVKNVFLLAEILKLKFSRSIGIHVDISLRSFIRLVVLRQRWRVINTEPVLRCFGIVSRDPDTSAHEFHRSATLHLRLRKNAEMAA
jgi:hypothetical protein